MRLSVLGQSFRGFSESGLWGQTIWAQIPAWPLTSCETPGKLLYPLCTSVSLWENGNNCNIYLIDVCVCACAHVKMNMLKQVKPWGEHPACSGWSLNNSNYLHYLKTDYLETLLLLVSHVLAAARSIRILSVLGRPLTLPILLLFKWSWHNVNWLHSLSFPSTG